MKRALVQLVAAVLFRSGLVRLWLRRRRLPLVVMYHRVLDQAAGCDLSQPGIVVSAPTFARQLAFLARHFRIVPLSSLTRAGGAAHGGGRPLCAVTFDDGWADNHRWAWPVLRAHGASATIFVTTGFMGSRRLFWPERLRYIVDGDGRAHLAEPPAAPGDLEPAVAAALRRIAAAPPGDELEVAFDELIEILKERSDDEREQLLDLLARHAGRDPAGLPPRMMTWREVGELAAAGIEIGSHGVSHRILTRIERAAAADELRESRTQLARELGAPPASFAYPNGDWDPELAALVEAAGYQRAVVTDSTAPAAAAPFFPFAVPRKNLAEHSSRGWRGFSGAVFACELSGLFDALRRWRRT